MTTSTCRKKDSNKAKKYSSVAEIKKRGKLRIITLYSSTTYFLYKGQPMGYEYELAEQFAQSIGVETQVIVAKNAAQLTQFLKEGKGDVVAFNLPVNKEMRDSFQYCGRQSLTHQVLVQQQNANRKPLTDVTQLVGKKITVLRNSRYHQRLINLNEELGGGIKLNPISKDSISTEDLIEKVSDGELDYTVADNDLAILNKTYFGNININLEISFPQRLSWVVHKGNSDLANALNRWFATNINSVEYQTLAKRYFEKSKRPFDLILPKISNGKISPYDAIFKKYAKDIDWDWRLLAALAYVESKFDPTEISWAGAKGLMQLMPRTSAAVGIYGKDIYDPDINVSGAVKSIRLINRVYANVKDKSEKQKFIIGAYNCGIGHIMDAQNLATKHGASRVIWDKNVAHYLALKSNSEYYTDNVCNYGYLRGSETCLYVKKVLTIFNYYTTKTKK
ncbi:MAG: transglycosylase SLT domain-containing protein [Bacteroidales bacterium]